MAFRFDRFLVIALIMTSAAVAVSADESAEDVDRSDFSDPALSEDVKVEASGPHSDIETTWIIPESPEGQVPIGGMTDLLVALANNGNKMFNMSHIVAKLKKADGTLYKDLGRFEYGQPLGPHEQRSFRYPMELEEEEVLGAYTLDATAYYADKQKSPFLSEVVKDEAVKLVPALPNRQAQMEMLQMVLGGVGMLLIFASIVRLFLGGGGSDKPKSSATKKAKGSGGDAVQSNEWLAGTLAGAENRSPKKSKRA